MSLVFPAIATQIVQKRLIRVWFGTSTGSRIAQDRRSPTSEGYGVG